MKLIPHGVTPFDFVKVGIGRTAGVILILLSGFLSFQLLTVEKEMSNARRGQLQFEKLQNRLTPFTRPQALITLPYQDLRDLNSALNDHKSLRGQGGTTTAQTIFDNYREYITGRGEISTFASMMEDIKTDVTKIDSTIKNIMPTVRGTEPVIALSGIKKSFENIQNTLAKMNTMAVGHTQYVALGAVLASAKDVTTSLSTKSKLLEKSIRDYRTKLLAPSELLVDELTALQNKNSFVSSQMPAVFSMSNLVAKIQEAMADAIGIQNAYLRLGSEHISHIAMMLVLALFGLASLAIGRIFARRTTTAEKVITVTTPKVSEVTLTALSTLETSTLSSFLAANMTTATAVTDPAENITWATNAFYQTLGLDPKKTYNWNELLESHIVRANSALGIEGAVSVLGKPGQELKLFSKTAQHGNENRILEFVPIYNYHAEMQKTVSRLAPFTDIPGVDIYEASETISEVSGEISYLFQTTDTLFRVEDERQIYIAFDKVLMRKNLKTLMTGLVIYLSQTNTRRLSVAYQKVGDVFSMTFTIPGHKFKEVTAPLVFRDKTYPSLSAYLEQIEIAFQKYNAHIVLKNVQKDGVDDAVIQWELTESDDALFNLETLEKKRRVHRVVKTAEKVNEKSNARKQNPTLGPKDFQ